MTDRGLGFESVADLYDEVRPSYPSIVYDELDRLCGGLSGRRVVDLAAGTGIATRELISRGADAVATDLGSQMLRRLRAVSPTAAVVRARGEQLPFRDGAVDLVTCATGWHWVNSDLAVPEVRRVLRPDGLLALWWANNRWGDGIDWEDARSAVYERWQLGHGSRANALHSGVGPREAADDLRARGLDVVLDQQLRWDRESTPDAHLRMIATHSDVIALGDRKQAFLDEMTEALAPWPTLTERLWGPLIVARVTPNQ